MEETLSSESFSLEDLSKRMKSTSTSKKKLEKILKIKRTCNIIFEMFLLMLNVFLVFLSLTENNDGKNIAIVSGLVGIAASIFIIYNKYIINIDELLFKNRTSYLMIDSIFKNLENNLFQCYSDYENALSIVDNVPDFVYYLTKNEHGFFMGILLKLKLFAYISFEYLFEIIILLFIYLYPY